MYKSAPRKLLYSSENQVMLNLHLVAILKRALPEAKSIIKPFHISCIIWKRVETSFLHHDIANFIPFHCCSLCQISIQSKHNGNNCYNILLKQLLVNLSLNIAYNLAYCSILWFVNCVSWLGMLQDSNYSVYFWKFSVFFRKG